MSLVNYIKESYFEFKDKVEWPKWSDLQSSTSVVAIATVILAILTFSIDYLFSNGVKNMYALLINFIN